VVRTLGARWRGAPLILTTKRFFPHLAQLCGVKQVSKCGALLYLRVFASAVRFCLETLRPMHGPESGTDAYLTDKLIDKH
jgi:hypothetical protein